MSAKQYKKIKNGKQKSSSSKAKWFVALLIGLIALLLFFVFAPNTGVFSQGEYLYIRTGSSYEQVKQALNDEGFVRDINSFDLLAKNAGYPSKIHPGKYLIKKGMSNFDIVRLLRSGKQTPVKLVIKKLRTQQDFIHLISQNLEADSLVLQHMFRDTVFLAQYGLDNHTVLCAVMPNTYEFYWNSNAEKVFKKIAQEYVRYWTASRRAQASALGLSPQQVICVASIVEEETNTADEKPLIASVYVNRFKKGMKLQADPTARFAYGDFSIKRITSVQTSFPSPYNTYQVQGLPPGPICTPSQQSIDAVLHAVHTDYLYFCAKEDFSGRHNFAASLQEHSLNAKKYHDALNARNIR